jgi:hypothetical protein
MVVRGEGTFEHLDDRYRRYAALPDEERIAWIKADRWIGFDQAQAALVRLNALLAYPPRDRMPCLLIYGNTGMGKTKIVRKFERAHPPTLCQPTGVTNRPVVVAQVPSEPIERDLYRELLASLQAPALVGGTLAREKDICRSLLRTVGAMLAAKPAARPVLPRVSLPERSPDEHASKALLAEAGIAAAPERIVQSAEEAVAAAEALGFPVAMKIVSPGIVHKSDIGGVRLGLDDAEAVRAAHAGILDAVQSAAPQARIAGVLVARQLNGGVECLMGISRDPVFGPVAVFDLGGIFVEILDDVAIRACPFDATTAREMILSIKAAGVLTGVRGRGPADLDALAAMLSGLSTFAAAARPRLRAIDLNPVLALPDGAYALDAVIEIEAEASA